MEQYTLIGHPLGHSMSPFIHERCLPWQAERQAIR